MFSYKKTFIVAEIGNNHEGKIYNAYKLIDEAAKSGVDAVKFQFIDTNFFLSNSIDKKRKEQLNKFCLKKNDFLKLSKYCRKKKVIFFSTVFDELSLKYLSKMQNIFKIASGDNDNIELINKTLELKKPTIISLGLLSLPKIKNLMKKLINKNNISLLHCISSYPTEKNIINLNFIKVLKKNFPKNIIGFSDHSIGIDSSIQASFYGAKIIEKHFTLDHNFSSFRDHKLSANPKEMSLLVQKIRDGEEREFCEKKKLNKNIKFNEKNIRRSWAVNKNMKIGEIITSNDLIMLRPQNGFKFNEKKKILGKYLKKNLTKNDLITKNEIK